MSTLSKDTAQILTKQLFRARMAMFLSQFLCGLFRWFALGLALWGVLFLSDSLVNLPVELRLPLGVFGFAVFAYTFYKWVISPIMRFYSLDHTALALEERYGVPRNLLINSYQLSKQQLTEEEAELARQTVAQGMGWVGHFRKSDIWDAKSLLKVLGVAAVAIVVWGIFAAIAPEHLKSSFHRYSFPFSDVPPPGRVALTVYPDEDIVVDENANHEILLLVETRRRHEELAYQIQDFYPRVVSEEASSVGISRREGGRGENMVPVSNRDLLDRFRSRSGQEPTEENVRQYGTDLERRALDSDTALFSYQFRDLRRSRAFRIFHDLGRTYTRSYRVMVEGAPEIVESRFLISSPDYTGLPEKEVLGPPRSVEGLPGSRIKVDVKLERSVDNLFWESDGEKIALESEDGRRWLAETTIEESGGYDISTLLGQGGERQVIASGSILTKRDNPPYVEFVTDRYNREAWPGQMVSFEIEAEDDYGISEIILEAELSGSDGARESDELNRWRLEGPPGDKDPQSVEFSFRLDPSRFAPGDEYMFRAKAKDFHPDRQTGHSSPIMVSITGMDELPGDFDASDAFGLLSQAIEMQQRALSNTRTVSNYMDAVLGLDPDSPDFTFYNHRHQIEVRQSRVKELLSNVLRLSSEPLPSYIEKLEEVSEKNVKPLVKRIGGLAGDASPWFEDSERVAASNAYTDDGEGWHEVGFDGNDARYVGLRFYDYDNRFAISNMGFIDAEGEVIPPPYVNKFYVSPHYKEWGGPVDFVDLTRDEFDRFTEKALNTPLKGDEGAVVNLTNRVEDAPDRNVTLYAVRKIICEEPRRVFLYAGSSDSLRVWSNGNLEINTLTRRSPQPDQNRVGLRLREGENIIVAEVSADNRDPALAMRFTDRDGNSLALTDDGHLVRAVEPQVVHAGDAPESALNVIDRDSNSNWRVDHGRPQLFIVDLGHEMELSGLRLRVPGGEGRNAFGSHEIFAARNLKIYDTLPGHVEAIEDEQEAILDRLTAIRTAWLDDDKGTRIAEEEGREDEEMKEDEEKEEELSGTPAIASEEIERLMAETMERSEESVQLAEQRRSVLDMFGDDFTEDALDELQEIKDRESRIAEILGDVVHNMSELGAMDMAEAQQVEGFSEFREAAEEMADLMEEKSDASRDQDITALDELGKNLYEELLTHGETTGFLDKQDIPAAVMEDEEDELVPLPLAELPQSLHDVIGEMEEAAMDYDEDDVEQESIGSQLQSTDDGFGPVSPPLEVASTSAQGKTGNQRPDVSRELEGRAGFGRTGRASGEGVGDVAQDIPQDDVVPPERDTGGSLEEGMVEDQSTEAAAEATGLGKQTDDTEEFGMGGGELPPGLLDNLRETARRSEEFRETTGEMVTILERHNMPSPELNRALEALERAGIAAEEGDIQAFRESYNQAIDLMTDAHESVGREVGLQYIKDRQAGTERDRDVVDSVDMPEGFEDMISEYFKALAGEDE